MGTHEDARVRHPERHIRDGMVAAMRDPEGVARLVRVAYGEVPPGPEGANAAAARAELVREGWLTEQELDALPRDAAEATARQRFGSVAPPSVPDKLGTGKLILADPEAFVWRYLDLAKFVSMLHGRSLYFCLVDRFGDQHEAALSAPTLERVVDEAARRLEAHPLWTPELDVRRIALEVNAEMTDYVRLRVYANCWHRNETEDAAMWKVYGDRGIAVRSRIGRLFASTRGHEPLVLIDEVKYVDHGAAEVEPPMAFLYKHRMYAYEREVRAYVLQSPREGEPIVPDDPPSGITVPCDLALMIDAVVVAPGTPGWFIEAVQSLLEAYGLTGVPVLRSEADVVPAYRADLDAARKRLRAERARTRTTITGVPSATPPTTVPPRRG